MEGEEGEDDACFAEIAAAHAPLSDAERRARYDHLHKFGAFGGNGGNAVDAARAATASTTNHNYR